MLVHPTFLCVYTYLHDVTQPSKLYQPLNIITSYLALNSTPLSHLTHQPNCTAFKRRHSLTTNIVTTTSCTSHVSHVGLISMSCIKCKVLSAEHDQEQDQLQFHNQWVDYGLRLQLLCLFIHCSCTHFHLQSVPGPIHPR